MDQSQLVNKSINDCWLKVKNVKRNHKKSIEKAKTEFATKTWYVI
jgi:hypothetical protein